MDKIEDEAWIAYQVGCERLGWTPLPMEQFWPVYQQYLRSHRFLQAWGTYRAQPGFAPLRLLQGIVMSPTVKRMARDRDRLGFVVSAIAAGRSEGEDGIGGVGARLPVGPGPREGCVSNAAGMDPVPT